MPSNAELQEEVKKLQKEIETLKKEKTGETDKIVELEKVNKNLQDQVTQTQKLREDDKKELHTALEDVRVLEEKLLRFKEANAAQAELSLQELATLVILALPNTKTVNGTPMRKLGDIEQVVNDSVPAATKIVQGVLQHLAGLNINSDSVKIEE